MAVGEHEWNAGAHHAGERLIVIPAVVLAALVVAYVIGAAVAASVGSSVAWLLLPAVVLGSTAFVVSGRIQSET